MASSRTMTKEDWREYYKEDPSRFKRAQIKYRYGITLEEAEALRAGGCDICGGDNGGKTLNIDHCKDTGTVRGGLCWNCNTAIGKMYHDPAILNSAARYLTPTPVFAGGEGI